MKGSGIKEHASGAKEMVKAAGKMKEFGDYRSMQVGLSEMVRLGHAEGVRMIKEPAMWG
eukprot:gene6515-3154_t